MHEEERRRLAIEAAEKLKERVDREIAKLVMTLSDGIKSSFHLLAGGGEEPYFVDFDYIVEEPSNCKLIAEKFSERIQEISSYREKKPDLLGFIEKDRAIGTIGALLLAGYVSSLTEIPFILIRHTRELPYAKLKISEQFKVEDRQRLKGKNVLIISDVSTTGSEIKEAIKIVKNNRGNVTDVLLYYSRSPKEVVEDLQSMGVTMHYLLNESQTRYFVAHPEFKEGDKSIKIQRVLAEVGRY